MAAITGIEQLSEKVGNIHVETKINPNLRVVPWPSRTSSGGLSGEIDQSRKWIRAANDMFNACQGSFAS